MITRHKSLHTINSFAKIQIMLKVSTQYATLYSFFLRNLSLVFVYLLQYTVALHMKSAKLMPRVTLCDYIYSDHIYLTRQHFVISQPVLTQYILTTSFFFGKFILLGPFFNFQPLKIKRVKKNVSIALLDFFFFKFQLSL